MGQQELLDSLKKNKGRWLTSREIAEKLKYNIGSIGKGLRRLKKQKFVFFRKKKCMGNVYEYKYRE